MTDTDTRINGIVIYHDGSSEYPPYPTKIAPTVELFQRVVGGYIEAVNLTMPDGTAAVMYVNEEGRLHGLPPNPLATALAQKLNRYFANQQIVGHAVVVGMRGCDDADVPNAVVRIVHQVHDEIRIAGYMATLRGEQR